MSLSPPADPGQHVIDREMQRRMRGKARASRVRSRRGIRAELDDD
jgi:hypothetical protein